MKIKTNQINDYQFELEVEVPVERWMKVYNSTLNETRKSVKLDGFRKGKVPTSMIKKRFGPAIESDAADKAVQEFYREALDKEDIHAIAPGDIKDLDYGDDKPFTFKAVVEIMPSVEVEGLDKLKTYIDDIELTGDDVDAGIDVLREEHSIISSHSGPAEKGCIVKADVQEVDSAGIPVLTHNWEDISIEIGKESFGTEVDTELAGISAGEDKVIAVPTKEQDEKGANKLIHYKFSVKEIQRKELPEVNDEFAASLNEEFKNVADLRDKVTEMMTERANNRAKVKMFSRLVDFLIENNRLDVPPSMIDWYLDTMIEDAKRSGKEVDEEKFRDNYRNSAIRNMKWYLMRKAIIDENNLEATEDEMKEEITKIAEQGGGDIKILKTHFQNPKNRNRLKDDIEEKKVLDFLESKAQTTKKKISYKDFIAQDI